jgi:phage tail sheath protein FI
MPINPKYPGVYIEEIESPVRTIVGVSTSMTAFVGRAITGPRNEPIVIHNFGEYTDKFGGLSKESGMSYAVDQYFLNGGKDAIIVAIDDGAIRAAFDRLAKEAATPGEYEPDPAPAPPATKLKVFEAYNYGDMGKEIAVVVKKNNDTSGGQQFYNIFVKEKYDKTKYDPTDAAKIKEWEKDAGILESIIRVSLLPTSARFIDNVLKQDSKYVRIIQNPRPTITDADILGIFSTDDAAVLKGTKPSNQLVKEVNPDDPSSKKGIYALDDADLFNILCIPPFSKDDAGEDIDVSAADIYQDAVKYCEDRRAILLLDPPKGWKDKSAPLAGISPFPREKNAAIFFPRIMAADSLDEGRIREFVPCGAIAGIFARTDSERGVWKAPAGTQANIRGALDLSVKLTDDENGELNPLGINCLRIKPPYGRIVWGSRTMRGADDFADQWKYIPVRRLALYLEESLYRGTHWVVFEPNDEPLWSQIRLNVGAFMHDLFLKGAFQGTKPNEAYLVKCDRETTTQTDIDRGIVNIVVGFAPLKPAEFVIIKIKQLAGQAKEGAA